MFPETTEKKIFRAEDGADLIASAKDLFFSSFGLLQISVSYPQSLIASCKALVVFVSHRSMHKSADAE